MVVSRSGSLVAIFWLTLITANGAQSRWANFNARGELAYATLEGGDRIMDFSSAGYLGGGAALPSVPVKATVSPSGGDDTEIIQEAIAAVSRFDAAAGFRGAVLLNPGSFQCKSTLYLRSSGVVLRGSGAGAGGTTINMTGPGHACIAVSGAISTREIGPRIRIVDGYVPSGATSFRAESAADLRLGDTLRISRPVTSEWITFMGMDQLVRDGKQETWLAASGEIYAQREVSRLDGNRVFLDIPFTDSFDARFLGSRGGTVAKFDISGAISQVGIEKLRIVSPPQPVEITQRHHQAIRMNGLEDGWLRDLAIEDTVNSITIGSSARRITVENVKLHHTVATKGAAKPADFMVSGAQILLNRCSGDGDNIFYFVTGPRVMGPIVLLNCVFHGNGHIQPHARWATGLLVDNCQTPEGGIDFMNRGEMGSGHGWTIGWAVAWNCLAKSFVIQQPPGAMNWAIGCKGERIRTGMPFGHQPNMPEGIFDSHDVPVTPESLYLAQLRERLGDRACRNIGY